MRYLSVCSGIEAASAAWRPLGWEPVAFSEIERFPCQVLKHHHPAVPNWGDMTKFEEWPDADVDLLVGGTPCQSFSVAGLRKGLDDPRGSLMLVYLAIARRYRPRWLVWENVPGVLSADGGRAFGTLLGGLAILGYGFAYRVLDARHFGLAQRRARVFVVGRLGDWRRAAAVLFERASLSGHPPPRREAGQAVAGPLGGSAQSGGFRTTDLDNSGAFIPEVAPTLDADYANTGGLSNQHIDAGAGLFVAGTLQGYSGGVQIDQNYVPEVVPQAMSAKWAKGSSGPAGDEVANLVAHALSADGFDASEDGTGRGTPIVPVAFQPGNLRRGSGAEPSEDVFPTLKSDHGRGASDQQPCVAFSAQDSGDDAADIAPTLRRGGDGGGVMPAVAFYAQGGTQGVSAGEGSAPSLKPGHGNAGHQVAVAFDWQSGGDSRGLDPRDTAQLQREQVPAVAFSENGAGEVYESDVPSALATGGGKPGQGYAAARQGTQVRRLTPRECERLQGFPDDYTLIPVGKRRGQIKMAADGPRYKALGNSMAVPVMAWIGRRIQMVDEIGEES